MQITEFINLGNIKVKFLNETDYIITTTMQNFKKGTIKNPYDRSIYKTRYLGVGKYQPTIDGKIKSKVFYYWFNMMKRCYAESQKDKNKSYFGKATICKEWHNFQNFAEWFYENIYEFNEGRLHIDKDILGNGNKVYSPDTCVIIPQRINMIFMKKPNSDGLPTCVSKNKTDYTVHYNGKKIGKIETLEEAIVLHDKHQLKHVKEVAHEYKDKIPEKVYNILINWLPESLKKQDNKIYKE